MGIPLIRTTILRELCVKLNRVCKTLRQFKNTELA